MSTTTSSRPLIGQAADDPENDADTEESRSSDNINENSQAQFDSEQTGSHDKEPLSMKRRVAFVGALLLCVFTVFAFAFLLPCHKPKCQKFPSCPGMGDQSSVNWTEKFSGITPGGISLADVTGDGRPDILVEFEVVEEESKNSSFLNQLCKSKNCHGSGILAIDGSCGNSLWYFSRNSSFGALACDRVPKGTDNDRHCMLPEEKVKLLLFNVGNGTTKWQSESPSEKISSFKFANDVDGDNVRDIVFIDEKRGDSKGGNINLLSGKTGKAIGGSLPLPQGHDGSSVLTVHTLSSAHQLVIFASVSKEKKNSSLWAISLRDLSEKMKDPLKEFAGEPWGKHRPDPESGFISIIKDFLIPVQPLLTDLDGDGVKDVVFLMRENGTSLLAMSGKDLTVMWKMLLPSDSSIYKFLQSQHSFKENSTDVVLLVEYANHSLSLMVFDGPRGKLSWLFHSKSGLPVAPFPVPSLLGLQQVFVIWLPKLEAKKLIAKEQTESQLQEESFDDYGDAGYKKHKKMPRRKRQVHGGMISETDYVTSLEWKYLHTFFPYDDRDDDEVDKEDVDDDDDDYEALNDPDFRLEDNGDSLPLSQRQFFNKYMHDKEEKDPALLERGYSEEPAFPDTVAEVGSQKERFDEMTDPDFHNSELKWELSGLTNRRNSNPSENHEKIVVSENSDEKKDRVLSSGSKKYEILSSSQKKDDIPSPLSTSQNNEDISVRGEIKDDSLAHSQKKEVRFVNRDKDEALTVNHKAAANAFPPRVHSTQKNLLESTVDDTEANFQEASLIQNSQFLTKSDKKENYKLEPVKKPSHQKRSVQASLKCTQSSNDDADTYVALLLLKDSQGRQQFAEITEEKPFYLDSLEYGSLFNVKSDAKLTPCLRLLPNLTSEPVLRETEEGLDLVYTVSFVSEDLSLHIGKVRKISMEQVFERLKSKKIIVKTGKQQSKRENDYSFNNFPRIMK